MRRRVAPPVRTGPEFERRWPGARALATECVLGLYVLVHRLEALSERWVRAEGMPSLAAFNVLTVLQGAGEPLLPSVIATRVMFTRGTVTGIVTSLERRRLIERRPHPTDRRKSLVSLTPRGRATTEAYLRRIHRAEVRLMSALTVRDQRRLRAAIARLDAALHDLTPP